MGRVFQVFTTIKINSSTQMNGASPMKLNQGLNDDNLIKKLQAIEENLKYSILFKILFSLIQ